MHLHCFRYRTTSFNFTFLHFKTSETGLAYRLWSYVNFVIVLEILTNWLQGAGSYISCLDLLFQRSECTSYWIHQLSGFLLLTNESFFSNERNYLEGVENRNIWCPRTSEKIQILLYCFGALEKKLKLKICEPPSPAPDSKNTFNKAHERLGRLFSK